LAMLEAVRSITLMMLK